MSLAHVLAANGELAHMAHIFAYASVEGRIGNALAEMLLAAAPAGVFAEVFETSFAEYHRAKKRPAEWHEGILDMKLEEKMKRLLALWSPWATDASAGEPE